MVVAATNESCWNMDWLCEKLGLLSVWCKELEVLHKEFVQFVTECIDLIKKIRRKRIVVWGRQDIQGTAVKQNTSLSKFILTLWVQVSNKLELVKLQF
jgi:hypothetical protein